MPTACPFIFMTFLGLLLWMIPACIGCLAMYRLHRHIAHIMRDYEAWKERHHAD